MSVARVDFATSLNTMVLTSSRIIKLYKKIVNVSGENPPIL
jgi:hypothetical protein